MQDLTPRPVITDHLSRVTCSSRVVASFPQLTPPWHLNVVLFRVMAVSTDRIGTWEARLRLSPEKGAARGKRHRAAWHASLQDEIQNCCHYGKVFRPTSLGFAVSRWPDTVACANAGVLDRCLVYSMAAVEEALRETSVLQRWEWWMAPRWPTAVCHARHIAGNRRTGCSVVQCITRADRLSCAPRSGLRYTADPTLLRYPYILNRPGSPSGRHPVRTPWHQTSLKCQRHYVVSEMPREKGGCAPLVGVP